MNAHMCTHAHMRAHKTQAYTHIITGRDYSWILKIKIWVFIVRGEIKQINTRVVEMKKFTTCPGCLPAWSCNLSQAKMYFAWRCYFRPFVRRRKDGSPQRVRALLVWSFIRIRGNLACCTLRHVPSVIALSALAMPSGKHQLWEESLSNLVIWLLCGKNCANNCIKWINVFNKKVLTCYRWLPWLKNTVIS